MSINTVIIICVCGGGGLILILLAGIMGYIYYRRHKASAVSGTELTSVN